jgi:hypothetical protein
MRYSPWASFSVSQSTAGPGTVWSVAVLYTTAGDNSNIIRTFPRKIRKYRVIFNKGWAASSVLVQLRRYERFCSRLDTQWIKELQYSNQQLCVPRTAYCVLRQSGPSFLYRVCL